MRDKIVRGTAKDGQIRFFGAVTTNLVEKARSIHGCSPVAAAALGRMLTGASMMGVMLKNDRDKLTVQINGKGEAGAIVTVANNTGKVKGYISNPNIDRPLNNLGKLDVGGAVGTDGMLAVIKDMGLKEPYVGQVPIASGEIAEDLTYYFAASEQTPSAVSLGVLVDTNLEVISAGGFIIQMMPEADDFLRDIIGYRLEEVPAVTAAIKDHENIEWLIEELFYQMDPQILEEYEPEFLCECSREKIETMLISLGEYELRKIAEEEETAEIVCHFCNEKYLFQRDDIYKLLQEAK